jgi:hypothetical protein
MERDKMKKIDYLDILQTGFFLFAIITFSNLKFTGFFIGLQLLGILILCISFGKTIYDTIVRKINDVAQNQRKIE